jgi:hypothetical protein
MNTKSVSLFLLSCLLPILLLAQKPPKAQVIVYGNGLDAWAAAVQSAKSNIPTLWINPHPEGKLAFSVSQSAMVERHDADGGLWAELLTTSVKETKMSDSAILIGRTLFQFASIENAALQMTNAQKSLQVLNGHQILKARKQGKQWSIETNNRQRHRVRALVDASSDQILWKLAGQMVQDGRVQSGLVTDGGDPLLKTSVMALPTLNGQVSIVPLGTLLSDQETALYSTRNHAILQSLTSDNSESHAIYTKIGQVMGAVAAYSAFFKQTSKQVDVRKVQGEILQYQARLLPYQDISIISPYRLAVERISLCGVLQPQKGVDPQKWYFNGHLPVSSQEVSDVLNTLYVRSTIWWKDHPTEAITLKELLDFIKFVSYKGHEIDLQAERLWSQRWRFDTPFSLDLKLNRTQFAVILDHFATPFHTAVTYQGRFMR